jgi:hypothetical protein
VSTASSFALPLQRSLRIPLLLALSLASFTSCGYFVRAPALITIPEVASNDLELPNVVLVTGRGRTTGDLHLRAIARDEVSRLNLDHYEILSHSGPDRQGRIAYLGHKDRTHELGLYDVASGAREVLAAAEGGPWDEPLGTGVALALAGNVVACIEYAGPSGLVLNNARIVIRSTVTREVQAEIRRVDRDVVFAPDGSWIAFTRNDAEVTRLDDSDLAKDLRRERSAVWRHDLATGEEKRLLGGYGAVIDFTGRFVFCIAPDDALLRFDLESGGIELLAPLGFATRIVGAPDRDHLVYYAFPTRDEGADVVRAWTVGPHQALTVKLVDLRDGRFRTLARGFSWFSRSCSLGDDLQGGRAREFQ